MKKQLKFIAPLALAAIMATSCGGKHTRYVPGTPLKVGLICLESDASTYDKNFINAFKEACETAIDEKWMTSQGEIETDIEESQECSEAAQRLIDKGCNVIFSDSYGHREFMKQMAIENPDVIFCSATGDDAYASGVQNYHNAFASIYEGRYLAGFAAGKYLEKNHKSDGVLDSPFNIGYVGAKDYAEVISGYTAWYLGVRAGLNEGLHRNNCSMVVRYTGTWYDEDAEYATATTLINDDHCILISQHADSNGSPRACEQHTTDGQPDPIPNVFYNITKDPEAFPKSYVASSRINWQPYFEQVIENTYQGRVIEGEVDRNWTGHLGNGTGDGSVNYDVNDKESEIESAVSEEANKLRLNTEAVFNTKNFRVSKTKNPGAKIVLEGADEKGDHGILTSYYADITGDFVPDEDEDYEFVKKGDINYVAESHYRSAPSFNLIIDGITEIKKK